MNTKVEQKPVFTQATREDKIEAIVEYCLDSDSIYLEGYGQIEWMDSQESWICLGQDRTWGYGSPEELLADATDAQLDEFIEDNSIFEDTKFDEDAEMYEEEQE